MPTDEMTDEDRAAANAAYRRLRARGVLQNIPEAHAAAARLVKSGILDDLSGGTPTQAQQRSRNEERRQQTATGLDVLSPGLGDVVRGGGRRPAPASRPSPSSSSWGTDEETEGRAPTIGQAAPAPAPARTSRRLPSAAGTGATRGGTSYPVPNLAASPSLSTLSGARAPGTSGALSPAVSLSPSLAAPKPAPSRTLATAAQQAVPPKKQPNGSRPPQHRDDTGRYMSAMAAAGVPLASMAVTRDLSGGLPEGLGLSGVFSPSIFQSRQLAPPSWPTADLKTGRITGQYRPGLSDSVAPATLPPSSVREDTGMLDDASHFVVPPSALDQIRDIQIENDPRHKRDIAARQRERQAAQMARDNPEMAAAGLLPFLPSRGTPTGAAIADLPTDEQMRADYGNDTGLPIEHWNFQHLNEERRQRRKTAGEIVQNSILPMAAGIVTGGAGLSAGLGGLLSGGAGIGAGIAVQKGQDTLNQVVDPLGYQEQQERARRFEEADPVGFAAWQALAGLPLMEASPLTLETLAGKGFNMLLGAGLDAGGRAIAGQPQDWRRSATAALMQGLVDPRLPGPVHGAIERGVGALPESVRAAAASADPIAAAREVAQRQAIESGRALGNVTPEIYDALQAQDYYAGQDAAARLEASGRSPQAPLQARQQAPAADSASAPRSGVGAASLGAPTERPGVTFRPVPAQPSTPQRTQQQTPQGQGGTLPRDVLQTQQPGARPEGGGAFTRLVTNNRELEGALRDTLDYTPGHARDVAAQYESIARAWSKREGRPVEDFYREYAGAITRGGEDAAQRLEILQDLAGPGATPTGQERGAVYRAGSVTGNRYDARRVMLALNSPDASTAIHELGHIFRLSVSDPNDRAILDRWVGAQEGATWTRDQHERFARAFEHWAQTGEAPNPSLTGAFSRFRDFLGNIYRNVVTVLSGRGSEGTTAGEAVPYNPEVLDLLQRYHEDVSDLTGEGGAAAANGQRQQQTAAAAAAAAPGGEPSPAGRSVLRGGGGLSGTAPGEAVRSGRGGGEAPADLAGVGAAAAAAGAGARPADLGAGAANAPAPATGGPTGGRGPGGGTGGVGATPEAVPGAQRVAAATASQDTLTPQQRAYVDRAQPREAWVPIENLRSRPDVFQFRQRTVADFPTWSEAEAGKSPVGVWIDRKGELGEPGAQYIVNGHHRYENARKFGPDTVPALKVRYIEAPDAQTAREIGALENLRDSARNDAVDVAQFLRNSRGAQQAREQGQDLRRYLNRQGVNTQGTTIRDALALSRLPDDAFNVVYNLGTQEPALKPIGAAVAENFDTPVEMSQAFRRAYERIRNGDKVTPEQIAEQAKIAKAQKEADRQGALFSDLGDTETRADVVTSLKKHFDTLIRSGKSLTGKAARAFYGVTGEQADAAQRAAQVGEIIDRNAHRSTPLGERITEAVHAISAGGDRGKITADLIRELETGDIITETLQGERARQDRAQAIAEAEKAATGPNGSEALADLERQQAALNARLSDARKAARESGSGIGAAAQQVETLEKQARAVGMRLSAARKAAEIAAEREAAARQYEVPEPGSSETDTETGALFQGPRRGKGAAQQQDRETLDLFGGPDQGAPEEQKNLKNPRAVARQRDLFVDMGMADEAPRRGQQVYDQSTLGGIFDETPTAKRTETEPEQGALFQPAFHRGLIVRLPQYGERMPITAQSSYEAIRAAQHDGDESVAAWERSKDRIPYTDPETGKQRRYHPDLLVTYRDGRQVVEEIKPAKMLDRADVRAKEEAARAFYKDKGIEYRFVTEEDLGNRARINDARQRIRSGAPVADEETGRPLFQPGEAQGTGSEPAKPPRVGESFMVGKTRYTATAVSGDTVTFKAGEQGTPRSTSADLWSANRDAAAGSGTGQASMTLTGPQAPPAPPRPADVPTTGTEVRAQRRARQLEMGDREQEARDRLRRIREGKEPMPQSTRERLLSLWKAGLLTSPVTHIVNIASNATFQGLEEAARVPASIADISRVALAHATGQQARLGADRQALGADLGAFFRASRTGATKGVAQAREIMRTGRVQDDVFNPETELSKAGIDREFVSRSPLLDGYVNGVFRSLTAEDRVFKVYALTRSLEEQANLIARSDYRNLRAKGQNPGRDFLGARAKELRENPTPAMIAQGVVDAEIATFNNPNATSEAVRAFKRTLREKAPDAAAALELVLPFEQTPTNVVARTLEYAAGTGIAPVRAARQIMAGAFGPEQQRAYAQTFGRGTVGLGLLALGYKLADAGLMTGYNNGAQDYGKREDAKQQEGSIYAGGRWWNLSKIAPLGTLLALGATIREREKGQGLAGALGMAARKAVSDAPLMNTAETTTNLLSGDERGATRFLSGLLGSTIPAIVASGAAQMDTTKRQTTKYTTPTGEPDRLRNLTAPAQNRVPFLRQQLPAKEGNPYQPNALIDPFASIPGARSNPDALFPKPQPKTGSVLDLLASPKGKHKGKGSADPLGVGSAAAGGGSRSAKGNPLGL